jgi:hypothetical protein
MTRNDSHFSKKERSAEREKRKKTDKNLVPDLVKVKFFIWLRHNAALLAVAKCIVATIGDLTAPPPLK